MGVTAAVPNAFGQIIAHGHHIVGIIAEHSDYLDPVKIFGLIVMDLLITSVIISEVSPEAVVSTASKITALFPCCISVEECLLWAAEFFNPSISAAAYFTLHKIS